MNRQQRRRRVRGRGEIQADHGFVQFLVARDGQTGRKLAPTEQPSEALPGAAGVAVVSAFVPSRQVAQWAGEIVRRWIAAGNDLHGDHAIAGGCCEHVRDQQAARLNLTDDPDYQFGAIAHPDRWLAWVMIPTATEPAVEP